MRAKNLPCILVLTSFRRKLGDGESLAITYLNIYTHIHMHVTHTPPTGTFIMCPFKIKIYNKKFKIFVTVVNIAFLRHGLVLLRVAQDECWN